jgi:GTPase SAR1 family protein
MDRKRWIKITCAATVPAVGIIGYFIGGPVAAVVGALVSTVGSGVFAPVREDIKQWVEHFSTPECRIVLFAHPGVGKTELRKRLLGIDGFVFGQKPTRTVSVLSKEFEAGTPGNRIKVKVSIYDYSGQKPSQFVGDYHFAFFGKPTDRRVDAVFFVVDAFPIEFDQLSKKQITDEELIGRCASNAQYMTMRIAANRGYIDRWRLEEVFEKVINRRRETPVAVRLLINKIDLFRALVEKGGLGGQTVEQYVTSAYAEIIGRIQEACAKNNIGDFACELTSAATGENTKCLVDEILARHYSPEGVSRDG